MFEFRKKTNNQPKIVIHRKKAVFAKKPISRRDISVAARSENDGVKPVDNWRLLYVFLWLSFFFVTVYVCIFSPFLRLNTIQVDGTVDISRQEIERFVQEEMGGKYLGIVPYDTIATFPRNRIEADAKERFKKIRSIRISESFPNVVTVRIEERKTLVIWCSGEACFSLDEEGYAYSPVDAAQTVEQGNGSLRITDTGAQSVEVGEQVLDDESVRFASGIRERLQTELGIETDTECSTPSRVSDQLSLKTKEGWLLHVDVRLPIDKSIRTLELLFQKEISGERKSRLKYVDLRTENRVYYSVEGETVSAPEAVTADGQPSTATSVGASADTEKKKK